jgi:chaperonin GroEL
MQESISSGKDLRKAIKKTTKIVSKAVKSTLGPSGTNVGVLSPIMLPLIVNDGVTVAKSFKFKDELTQYIYNILKTVSQNTDNVAGDGTTTATTLAGAIILGGIKHIEAGFSQIDIAKGIRAATVLVLAELETKRISVIDNKKMLLQVSSISANNDPVLGKLISDAFLKIGVDGQIEMKNSADDKTYIDIIDGMKYASGFESNMFINTDKSEVHLEQTSILLYEGKLESIDPILDAMRFVRGNNTSLLIIADDFAEQAINDLAHNKVNVQVKVCAVKTPGYGIVKVQNLQDLADVTGATIISKRFGSKIEDLELSQLGLTTSVKITSDEFTLINEDSDKALIEKKVAKLKVELKNEQVQTIKDEISDRIAKLSNGVAVMYVAGNSPVETAEKKFRIEDAMNATRASLEEGVVVGGGITLMKIARDLEMPKLDNVDQEIGFSILLDALSAPIKTICKNAGESGEVIINNINRNKDFNYGYDAKLKEYKDLVKGGVLDPLKVTKAALTNAASVSQLLLTMDTAIYG